MFWTTSPLSGHAGLVAALLCLAIAGCTGSQATAEPSCGDLPRGLERDQCYHQEIGTLPAAQVDKVIELASLIDDPMIRGAAVSEWASNHTQELPKEKCQGICQLLEGRDRSYCQRRCSSPHLQR